MGKVKVAAVLASKRGLSRGRGSCHMARIHMRAQRSQHRPCSSVSLAHTHQVDAAVRLMCDNAMRYNSDPEHDVHRSAQALLGVWQEQWEQRHVATLWTAAQDAVGQKGQAGA